MISDCFLNIRNLKNGDIPYLYRYLILFAFLFLGNTAHAQLFISDSSQLYISEGTLFVIKNSEEEIDLISKPEKATVTISHGAKLIHSEDFQNVEIIYLNPKEEPKPILAISISQEKKPPSEIEYTIDDTVEQELKPVLIFKTLPGKNSIVAGNVVKLVSTTVTNLFIFKLVFHQTANYEFVFTKSIHLKNDAKLNSNWYLNSIWARPPPMYSLT